MITLENMKNAGQKVNMATTHTNLRRLLITAMLKRVGTKSMLIMDMKKKKRKNQEWVILMLANTFY